MTKTFKHLPRWTGIYDLSSLKKKDGGHGGGGGNEHLFILRDFLTQGSLKQK